MLIRKKKAFIVIFSIAIFITLYLGYTLFSGNREKVNFLPSITSNGHHQLEEKCDICHEPFKKGVERNTK
ncbi:MAG: hypothetical protein D3903_13900 [Candidatus Electrothrix sp. GM3_4]|nr:hypothetical protein [Candidatus Electrothrix sp. GM3_4]